MTIGHNSSVNADTAKRLLSIIERIEALEAEKKNLAEDVKDIYREAKSAGFDGPVTPWADRATLVGRGREKIVKLAGDRLEAAWKEAGLPIAPRWFTPVQRDQFGRPIDEASFVGAE